MLYCSEMLNMCGALPCRKHIVYLMNAVRDDSRVEDIPPKHDATGGKIIQAIVRGTFFPPSKPPRYHASNLTEAVFSDQIDSILPVSIFTGPRNHVLCPLIYREAPSILVNTSENARGK